MKYMSEFISNDRFEDHMRDCEEKYKEITDYVEKMDDKIENCVTYKNFTWTLGILVTILIALFSYIANQIKEVQINTNSINTNVSKIQGKLEPYNIEFRNE